MKELKVLAAKFDGVTASKNRLKVKYEKKVVGELFLEHLPRVDSYVLGGLVYGGMIHESMIRFNPPYKSNLFNEGCFSFLSSGEGGKRFSGDFGGAIKTPDASAVPAVCTHIARVLKEHYLPKILACIVPSERTINDTLLTPDEYSYPAVFIHCAAATSDCGIQKEQIEQALTSRRIIKNKDYDAPLLTELLR